MSRRSFLAELRRRNVLRAGALYIGAVWALAQGLAQLFPVFGVPDWVVRWIVVAAAIGFPFFLAFAWFYEFTPEGLKRESEIAPGDSIAHRTGKQLDRGIIAVLSLAVVLLLANQLVMHRDAKRVAAQPPAAGAAIPAKSIAVLPFANDSGDQDQQYFSDGLSQDLITALSQFAGLKVISRNSAFQFRNARDAAPAIGRKLGVAHLLEGSVRRVGDQVRVTAELVKAADGSTLWSQRYDRPYQDLFKLQDDITTTVANALRAELLAGHGVVVQNNRPPSGNLDAYNAFIEGSFFSERGSEAGYRSAIEHYRKAINLDPRYAAAQAGLAMAWGGLATRLLGDTERQDGYVQARAAIASALALDPDLAAAHSARAYLLTYADFDWKGAETSARRALELAPNNGVAQGRLAFLLATLGQTDQAIKLARRALATDPLGAGRYQQLARYLSATHRLDEAATAVGRAIELQPRAPSFHEQLAIIEILRGNAAAALRAAQQETPGAWQDAAYAMAWQANGDTARADAALKTLIDRHAGSAAYQVAEVYALRGQPAQAFEWLDRAWALRDPGISLLLFDPFLLREKDDPRFAAFCRRVGLPPPHVDPVASPARTQAA